MTETSISASPSDRRVFLSLAHGMTRVNAYNCALLASLAYSDADTIAEFFKCAKRGETDKDPKTGKPYEDYPGVNGRPFLGFGDPFTFSPADFYSDGRLKGTDTQFFVARNSRQVIISVRGTHPLNGNRQDIWQDAKFTKVLFDGSREYKGEVHKGFNECFQYVKSGLEQYIDHQREFIVTGHSLGGGVATLVAAHLKLHHNLKKVMLYTYGSPRVCSGEFAAQLHDLDYYRFVNGNDIVTMVPPPGVDMRPYLFPFAVKKLLFGLSLALFDISGDFYTHFGKRFHLSASAVTDAADGVDPTGMWAIPGDASLCYGIGRTATMPNLQSTSEKCEIPFEAFLKQQAKAELKAVFDAGMSLFNDHGRVEYVKGTKQLVKDTCRLYQGNAAALLTEAQADYDKIMSEIGVLKRSDDELVRAFEAKKNDPSDAVRSYAFGVINKQQIHVHCDILPAKDVERAWRKDYLDYCKRGEAKNDHELNVLIGGREYWSKELATEIALYAK